MRSLTRLLKRIGPSQSGVAAVEFALVAPIFFALLIGIIDLGKYVWTINTVQFAVDDAIRVGVIQELSDNEIQQQVEKNLVTVDNGTMVVTVESSTSDVTVTANGTYSFMFPMSMFLSSANVSIKSVMPM